MERNEAMRQLGRLTGEMLDAADTQKPALLAAYNQVLFDWVPGTHAVFLVEESRPAVDVKAGRVTLALIVPACHWRRLKSSEPTLYASVVVVVKEDGLLTIEKNRFGTDGPVTSLDQVEWLPGASFSFKTAL